MIIDGANMRQDKILRADRELLDMHADFKVRKLVCNVGHGVIPSVKDDWRSKNNRKQKIVTSRQVTELPFLSV